MKSLQYLNKYLFKYKGYMIWGLVFVIVSNFFQILPAQVVRWSIDMVVENISTYRFFKGSGNQVNYFGSFSASLLFYAALILIMALLRGLFLYLVRQTLIVMSRHIEYDLKNEIYSHYQQLSVSFYRRNNTGDLLNRISEDVSRVRMYIGPSIMYGMQLVSLFLTLIPIMYAISPRLTLYAIAPLPLLSFSIYYVHNIIEKRSTEIQESQSRLSTFVQEAFSGIRVLKSFARELDSGKRFLDESNVYRYQSVRLTRVQALFYPLMVGLIGISTILTIYAGSDEVIGGRLSFGNIAEFVIYINLLTWPVTLLGWTSSMVQRAEASQKRINEFLQTQPEIVSEKNLIRAIEGSVEFKNVDFIYPDTGIHAIRNLSFRVQPGSSVAIIGTTGSGKSTVAALTARLYDATKGAVLIDNLPIQDYQPENLREQMGFVTQDVFLFSDTIYNNIGFGIGSAQQEAVVHAAQQADILDNINDFPEGFETRIGERGIMLSGGQKQRVSIARAIIKKPSILILDDALSAVDTRTEDRILQNLKEEMRGRTTMIISHRASSAKLAENIIVLSDGSVMEEGNHDELMKKGGFYSDLVARQLQPSAAENV
ncbi:MAG: ABC transporter ATP-binding protein [Bacteroidetes bacterium]|nr:ABC transporter ATP-binding protein [Bacteroidota bacterium]